MKGIEKKESKTKIMFAAGKMIAPRSLLLPTAYRLVKTAQQVLKLPAKSLQILSWTM